jgi:hypothetical protein
MGHIQKATAAGLALIITLAGATLAVAPLALADFQPVAARAFDGSAIQFYGLAADPRPTAASTRVG